MKTILRKLSSEYFDYCFEVYKKLHTNPELSFAEYQTSKLIQQELTKAGIQFQSGLCGTGIVAKIEGTNPQKRTIALRADMDALPVEEQTNLPWKSKISNTMHACGHDAHTACLLSAAMILNKIRDSFEGTVLLIFQPAEEKAPGGASIMLEEGLFADTKPDIVLAQHVSVDFPTGSMAFLPGIIMASADEIHVKIKGKGGHGALPHLSNDTVLAASQTIVALQQLKSRLCHPLTPMVLTFGRLIANGATNIIPHEVELSGTFRTFDEIWRKQAKEHIIRIITETCAAHGCHATIEMPDGYPCVNNNTDITIRATKYAEEWVGENEVKKLEVRMTSEDFGFISQQYPSCFYRFGVKGNCNINTGGLHSSTFEIDPESLKTGLGGMAWLCWCFLNE